MIHRGLEKETRAEVFDSWFVRHGRAMSDFRRKLRSNHVLNKVELWAERGRIIGRAGQIMGRTGSNHKSDGIESWFERGLIMGRTGSNHESSEVKSWVERGRIIGRTGSNLCSSGVESRVEWGQIMVQWGRTISRTALNHYSNGVNCESHGVEWWKRFREKVSLFTCKTETEETTTRKLRQCPEIISKFLGQQKKCHHKNELENNQKIHYVTNNTAVVN